MAWAEVRRSLGRRLADPLARLLLRTHLHPNYLTLLGFILNAGVAVVLAYGHLFLGGFLVLLAGGFDLLDGAVARLQGRATRFGALLDSTLDRFSEAALLAGLLIHYLEGGAREEVYLLFAALAGSLLVSYVKARAEGLGLRCETGLLTRPERVVLLAVGLISGQMRIFLWVLAVLANLTAFQRLFHVWRQARKG